MRACNMNKNEAEHELIRARSYESKDQKSERVRKTKYRTMWDLATCFFSSAESELLHAKNNNTMILYYSIMKHK